MKPAWVRQALVGSLILGYALLAHYSNAAGDAPVLGAMLAVAPLVLALLMMARRAPRPWLAVPLALICSTAVLLQCWQQIERNFSLLYLLQQCGIYLVLGCGFGRSLLPGREPLCTQWARQLRGPLPQNVRRYTRAVTAAWTIFFGAIMALCVALYVLAPLWLWSLFSNFLTLPLVVLMFVGEHMVRRRLVPSMRGISLADTVRAYVLFSRSRTAPRI